MFAPVAVGNVLIDKVVKSCFRRIRRPLKLFMSEPPGAVLNHFLFKAQHLTEILARCQKTGTVIHRTRCGHQECAEEKREAIHEK
jgi:hypothetical protein